ncbi:hypothetical protein [Actinomadura sp. WMMA1423]|uniref:hypothetical protein n=1 Tax=Actinomadura sp. WMMA1423 TaxID=2591108 RepID=UPI0011468A65|nr:hypothetical protein [Actinomadura sp. WMMA1423]
MNDALFNLPAVVAPPAAVSRPRPSTRRRRPAPAPVGLFDPGPDVRRQVDALTCLRDSVPEAMNVVVHLDDWRDREDRGIGASGDWAYSLRRDGFHYEHTDEWWKGARSRGERYGWDRTPAHLVTWDELRAHLGDHPARASVLAWVAALPTPSWNEMTRPYELWPNPGEWHPGYITRDRERPTWPERSAAWTALQTMCTEAIVALESA